MSRRVYLLGVGLALVALALAFTDWALSLLPGVTEANVKRVRPGMRRAEVEALLGGLGVPLTILLSGMPAPRPLPGVHTWSGEAGWVRVYENANRRVESIQWIRRFPRPGRLSRLRASLGW
jgi:hypothetical protein